MKELIISLPCSLFDHLRARARSERTTINGLVAAAIEDLAGARPRRRNDFSPRMTAAQAKRQRKQLERELSESHRSKDLAKLADLRRQISEAQKSAKPRRGEAVELCRIGRQMAKDRAKVLRVEGRAAIREAIRQEKIAAREACDARKKQVTADVKTEVARARAAVREEKKYQREIARIESRARRKQSARSSSSERRAESDDAVRSNIPDDLRPLFERVKRQIKASDRESRTESFLRYAEENPSEVIAAIAEQSEREIARLQREEAKQARGLRQRGYSAGELAGVPF